MRVLGYFVQLLVALALLIPACHGQCGDADRSGDVNVLDAMMIAQEVAQVLASPLMDLDACDVDLSGNLTIVDALKVAQKSTGLGGELYCPLDPPPLPPPPPPPPPPVADERIYVCLHSNQLLVVVDPTTTLIDWQVNTPVRPLYAAPNPARDELYFSENGRDFYTLDTSAQTISGPFNVPGPWTPNGMACTPDGTKLVLSRGTQLVVYDLDAGAVIGSPAFARVSGGRGTVNLVFTADSQRLFISAALATEIVELDIPTSTVARRLPTTYSPGLLAFDEFTGLLYVADRMQAGIHVVDAATGVEAFPFIDLSAGHGGISGLVHYADKLFVAQTTPNEVIRSIDKVSHAVTLEMDYPWSRPESLAVSSRGKLAFCSGTDWAVRIFDGLSPAPARRQATMVGCNHDLAIF